MTREKTPRLQSANERTIPMTYDKTSQWTIINNLDGSAVYLSPDAKREDIELLDAELSPMELIGEGAEGSVYTPSVPSSLRRVIKDYNKPGRLTIKQNPLASVRASESLRIGLDRLQQRNVSWQMGSVAILGAIIHPEKDTFRVVMPYIDGISEDSYEESLKFYNRKRQYPPSINEQFTMHQAAFRATGVPEEFLTDEALTLHGPIILDNHSRNNIVTKHPGWKASSQKGELVKIDTHAKANFRPS